MKAKSAYNGTFLVFIDKAVSVREEDEKIPELLQCRWSDFTGEDKKLELPCIVSHLGLQANFRSSAFCR